MSPRLVNRFISSIYNPSSGIGKFIIKLISDYPKFVLFAYSFESTVEERIDNVLRSSELSSRETLMNIDTPILINVDRIDVKEGSIDILLWVKDIDIPSLLVTSSLVAGPMAIWLSDKLIGSGIGRFGELFVENLLDKMPHLGVNKDKDVRNIELEAKSIAERIAKERGCKAQIFSGGILRKDFYQYEYQFVGCNINGLIVRVSKYKDQPAQIRVIR